MHKFKYKNFIAYIPIQYIINTENAHFQWIKTFDNNQILKS